MNERQGRHDRFVGAFRELSHGNPDGPSLRAAVRLRGEPYESVLVKYLRAGSILAATGARVVDVLSSGAEVIGGLALLTDGEWLWYSDLAHYVERYHVRLESEFVERVRRLEGTPPRVSRDRLLELEELLGNDDE
ncbi:hypothetical protein ACSNOI_24550 [Actinomadura kijaniata]|uniref:hypothetical protein n=1 Tax=Actinomadura kijaniata TaxID=46161 RepID=UPI003F1CD1D2